MSDRVHIYNRRYRKYGNTYANQCLLESIKEIMLEFIYFVPVQKLDLPEEDASDFVLYVIDKLESIIASYRDEANDFYAYLSAVLDNKVKTFFRNRKASEIKEKSAVAAQFPFEVRCSQNNNGNLTVFDNRSLGYGQNICAGRLRFASLSCKATQRHLFVYLLSLVPFLAMNLLESLCYLFCIDFKQTKKIVSVIEENSINLTESLNFLITRRNVYFSRSLALEDELSKNFYLEDSEKTDSTLEQLEKTRRILHKKNSQISKFQCHANYDLIGKILNMPKSSVGCSVFYSKNLISWCDEEEPSLDNVEPTGLGKALAETLADNSWKEKMPNVTRRSILYPDKAFDLHLSLNEHLK